MTRSDRIGPAGPGDSSRVPRARSQGILVEELEGETLVYDLDSHEAHCLNPAAALIWESCDGETRLADVTRRLESLGLPEEESIVWMGLHRLGRAGLLEDAVTLPAPGKRYTRKAVLDLLGKAGVAVLLPVVGTIVAPLAAQAASCITLAECQALNPTNCTGLPICATRGKCCGRKTSGRRTYCDSVNC